jgi:hypothetical protein
MQKFQSRDKDYRYMATSDLIAELQSDQFNIDSVSQKKLVDQVSDETNRAFCTFFFFFFDFFSRSVKKKKKKKKILLLLDDTSNDVQEIAAKCLGPLVKNVSEAHVLNIAQTLVGHLLNADKKKDELRDISSIGLRTVFAELNPNDPATKTVVESLAAKLVQGIVANDEKTPAREQHLLEVLAVLLERFGQLVVERQALQRALLPLLESSRSATRKRAIDCLALLAVHESNELFGALIEHLLKIADAKGTKLDQVRTVIQLFGAVSRSVGYKLGPYLARVVPLVARHCDSEKAGDDQDLREHCLQCFETLLQRCPADITPHVDTIQNLALKYLSFDPNYAADSDGEDAADMDEDNNDGFDDDQFSDEQLSDDDDMSWKVRRACAKCLSALLVTRPERVAASFETVAPRLLKRFAEREENVKIDIFDTYRTLLRQTRRSAASHGAVGARSAAAAASATPSAPDAEASSIDAKLAAAVPEVVKTLAKQAAAKSAKTRLGALGVLRALAQVAPAATLAPLAAEFTDAVARSLVANERDGSNLRIEALLLLRQLLVRTPPTAFAAHVKTLTPHVLKAVGDSYYRVSSEGLRTCAALVPTLAAADAAQQPALAASVYSAVLEKMSLSDVDQDVKESAIQCAGELVSLLGDKLAADALASVLKLLYERMCNEITRLTAVRTLERIASAPTHVSLGAVLGDATAELGALLRQSARQLRQSALQCLCTVVERYGGEKACSSKLDDVLAELVPLVGDSDLHLAHLALKLGRTIVMTNPKSAQTASDKLLTPLVALLSSSLLQGAALESVRAFVGELSTDGKRAAKLVERLRLLVGVEAPLGVAAASAAAAAAASTASTASTAAASGGDAVTLSTCSASAQCIAVCAAAGGAALVEPLVTDVLKELKSKKVGDGRRVADLLVLRELGARVDLTAHNVQAALLASFDGVEDVKQSAALALGGSVVGNVGKLLPGVLKELASSDKQYLILSAVREVITRSSKTPEATAALLPFVGTLLPLLVERCESKEEGTRNVVAECIGKLAMLAPAEVVPQLAKLLSSDKPATRATIVTALKCAIVERPHPIDAQLAPLVPAILRCLSDSDLHCRKATLLAFQYAAHCKPSLVAALIPQFRDALYGETRIKPELVREVDLGPFKHKVDDGYELRKAAYECCFTLLGAGFARVMDAPKFIKHLVQALTDENDIRMLAHLIIARLAAVAGASLLEGLDQLVEPLRTTLLTKPKESAVKQEQDVVAELVRSAMRAVRAVAALDGIESCVAFKNMHQSLLVEGELKEQFSAVMQEEASGPELGSSLTQSASFAF